MGNSPHADRIGVSFLACALEAVEEAALARGPVARGQWLKIAEIYRELAVGQGAAHLCTRCGKAVGE